MARKQEPGAPGSGEKQEERQEKQEINWPHQLREEIKAKSIDDADKPFEQWSEDEKSGLAGLLNNFYMNVPGGADTYEGRLKIGVPVDLLDKIYPYDVVEEMSKPLRYRLSNKRLRESKREFQKNIEQAFIKSGIDMKELKKRTEKFIEAVKKQRQDEDSQDWINVNSLPAIFDLLDSGYTIYDLTR